MRLYVDLETLQLIEGPGFRNPVTSLRFKRGDAALLEVRFLSGGTTPTHIGDPTSLEMHFGVKPRGRYDVGYLVHSSVWGLPVPADTDPLYKCSPSFNTTELNAAMLVGSPTGSELSEMTLMGEITWRVGLDEPTSTRTFQVVVENDVNRGTEGVPTEAEPPYPTPDQILLLTNTDWLASKAVRYDAPQTPLDQPARDQFMANFGATLVEALPGPALRAVQLLDGDDNPWLTYDGMDANFAAYTLIASAFAGTSIWDTSLGEEVINLSSKQLMQGGYPVVEWSGSTLNVLFPDLTVAGVATGWLMDSYYSSRLNVDTGEFYSSGSMSLDVAQRYGNSADGQSSMDWENRVLLNSSSSTTVDWNNASLYDPYTGSQSIDWGNRVLKGSYGNDVAFWNDGYFQSNGDVIATYGLIGQYLAPYSSFSNPVIDIENRALVDPGGNTAIDWNSYGSITLHADTYGIGAAIFSDVGFGFYDGNPNYGITDTIDLTTATSLEVKGGIITGWS